MMSDHPLHESDIGFGVAAARRVRFRRLGLQGGTKENQQGTQGHSHVVDAIKPPPPARGAYTSRHAWPELAQRCRLAGSLALAARGCRAAWAPPPVTPPRAPGVSLPRHSGRGPRDSGLPDRVGLLPY